MLDRKRIKKDAKQILKKNYWTIIFVCLVMFLLAGSYTDSIDSYNIIHYDFDYNESTNYDVTNDILEAIFETSNVDEITNFDNVTGGLFKFIFNLITNFEKALFNITKHILNFFKPSGIIIAIIVFIINSLYKIFIANPLIVGESRFFLENRKQKIKFYPILYSFKKNRYLNIVKTNFRKDVYLFLWSLTIVGVAIKSYSYKLVNYILAINPNINSKEAINLSRKMMHGYKWEAFKLDCTFIGWNLLSSMTYRITGILLSNPYYRIAEMELFDCIKNNYINNKCDKYELLLNDIIDDYSYMESIKNKMSFPKNINYYKHYSLNSMVLFFFFFSIFGFLWEVFFHFIQYGELVKRGALYGPWLPIYGSGCVVVLLLLIPKKSKKITDNPLLTFLIVMVTCSLIEYGTSLYLEITKGARWWDYDGFFLNINGRICLESALFFGIGGTCCIYLIAPFLERLFCKIPDKIRTILGIGLVLLISCDFIYSHFKPNTGIGVSQEIEHYDFTS